MRGKDWQEVHAELVREQRVLKENIEYLEEVESDLKGLDALLDHGLQLARERRLLREVEKELASHK